MASIKISELYVLSTISGDDFLPIVDSASLSTYRTPISSFGEYMGVSGSALTSSWASSSLSSSYSLTASYAYTASHAFLSKTASYVAIAASATTASYVATASSAITSSYSFFAITASHVDTASYAITSSYSTTASYVLQTEAAYQSGQVLQKRVFRTNDILNSAGTTDMPSTSFPVYSQGTLINTGDFSSITFTPLSANSRLLIEVQCVMAEQDFGGAGNYGMLALFNSNGAADSAIAVTGLFIPEPYSQTIILTHQTTASATPKTFYVRFGHATAGSSNPVAINTLYYDSPATYVSLGDNMWTTMTITEFIP